MTRVQKWALVVLSGLFYFLSFPPFPLGFLAPVSLALMLPLMLLPSRKEAFWYPFFSGLVFNLGLLYWIPYLMEKGLYAVLIIGMALLLSYMAFWVGLTGLLVNIVSARGRARALFAFPVIWTAQEKFRELGEMSFPWVTAGYTYGPYTRLIQFLCVGGVYFYTLLIAVTAALLFLVFRFRENRRSAISALGCLCMIYALLLFYGERRITTADKPGGETLKIALIQANIDQNEKWSPGRTDSIFNLHCRLTREVDRDSLDLAVWAESALPCYFRQRWGYRLGIVSLCDSLKLPLIFGSLDAEADRNNPRLIRYYNSVFYYAPGTGTFLKYDKIKLVPFGEQLPFEGYFPIISRVNLGEADFSRGDSLHLFDLKGHKIFTPICYEVVYPDQMRAFVRAGGEFMVQVTNDAWYRRSGMTFQHANICRYRAVETGVPIARCANTGLSCFIDPFGRMDKVTDIFTCVTPWKAMPVRHINTFFVRHGEIVGWVCLFAALGYFIILFVLTRFRKKHG